MAEETPEQVLAGAGAALSRFAEGPARDAADAMSGAFEVAAKKIADQLAHAAASGELSFKRLAKTVLEAAAKVALDQIFPGPQPSSKKGGDIPGGILSAAASALTVNFNLGAGADADSLRRNQSQIAAQVARAAAYGARNQ